MRSDPCVSKSPHSHVILTKLKSTLKLTDHKQEALLADMSVALSDSLPSDEGAEYSFVMPSRDLDSSISNSLDQDLDPREEDLESVMTEMSIIGDDEFSDDISSFSVGGFSESQSEHADNDTDSENYVADSTSATVMTPSPSTTASFNGKNSPTRSVHSVLTQTGTLVGDLPNENAADRDPSVESAAFSIMEHSADGVKSTHSYFLSIASVLNDCIIYFLYTIRTLWTWTFGAPTVVVFTDAEDLILPEAVQNKIRNMYSTATSSEFILSDFSILRLGLTFLYSLVTVKSPCFIRYEKISQTAKGVLMFSVSGTDHTLSESEVFRLQLSKRVFPDLAIFYFTADAPNARSIELAQSLDIFRDESMVSVFAIYEKSNSVIDRIGPATFPYRTAKRPACCKFSFSEFIQITDSELLAKMLKPDQPSDEVRDYNTEQINKRVN